MPFGAIRVVLVDGRVFGRTVMTPAHVLAIELLCGAQGIDYRRPLAPGVGVRRAHRAVRTLVAPLDADRVPSGDITRLAEAVAGGQFDFEEPVE